MNFHIENMTCGGCARGVTMEIKEVDPDATIVTDLPTKSVQVQTKVAQAEVVSALINAGFSPTIQ